MRHPPRRFQRCERGRRDRGVRDARDRADDARPATGTCRLLLLAEQSPDLGAGYVGILSVELHFPEAGSLKGKRKHVKSAKAQLQNRFGASVAEVDHHELWQRARLTLACVAREHHELDGLLDSALRYLHGQEYEVTWAERQIVVPHE